MFNYKRKKDPIPLTTGLLILLFMIIVPSPPVVADGEQEGKILIMVYTAGGSLETDYNLISEDIQQMVTGAGNTTPDIFEVLVAYGGSKKPGWQGMKIANLSLLSADLADGKLGNRSLCLASFPDEDMGNAQALGRFLLFAREKFRYTRIFLILIGHGEAYTGMLFDQNHGNNPLSLPEMVTALQQGGYNVELAGFDSCMMGSLEIASRLSGYARYMIASEESEPAEGWRYDEFISFLSEHPDANATAYGEVLLRGYLNNKVSGKTLSLLDLGEAGAVTAGLAQYSKNLLPFLNTQEGFYALRQAFHASQQFGLTANGTLDPATMDLADMIIQTSRADPLLVEPAQDLGKMINRMVLLSGHDDAVPAARGISILSPVQINTPFYQYYREEASITPAWDQFITRYLEIADNQGTMTPVISWDNETL